MTHLSEVQIDQLLFSTTSLGTDASAHLATCASCQQLVAELQILAHDLNVARQSQPTSAAVARYQQVFDEAKLSATGLGARIARVVATLAWDSRQQPALQGVRGNASAPYRLLFSSPQADMEVAISGRGSLFSVEGEFIQRDGQQGPALVSLTPIADARASYDTETDKDGRFRFAEVQAGRYKLAVVPVAGVFVEIEDLAVV